MNESIAKSRGANAQRVGDSTRSELPRSEISSRDASGATMVRRCVRWPRSRRGTSCRLRIHGCDRPATNKTTPLDVNAALTRPPTQSQASEREPFGGAASSLIWWRRRVADNV